MHYSSIRQYASHMRQRNSSYNKANISGKRHSWQSTRFLKVPGTFTVTYMMAKLVMEIYCTTKFAFEGTEKRRLFCKLFQRQSKVILQHLIGCKNEQHSKANVQCSSTTWWSRLQPTEYGARVLTEFNWFRILFSGGLL
jgi:hypothetical protein